MKQDKALIVHQAPSALLTGSRVGTVGGIGAGLILSVSLLSLKPLWVTTILGFALGGLGGPLLRIHRRRWGSSLAKVVDLTGFGAGATGLLASFLAASGSLTLAGFSTLPVPQGFTALALLALPSALLGGILGAGLGLGLVGLSRDPEAPFRRPLKLAGAVALGAGIAATALVSMGPAWAGSACALGGAKLGWSIFFLARFLETLGAGTFAALAGFSAFFFSMFHDSRQAWAPEEEVRPLELGPAGSGS